MPANVPAHTTGKRRVDLTNAYHRVLAIVPMTGAVTHADPKRPMFAPAPNAVSPQDRTQIIAWQHQPSDDGTLAIVEFVALTLTAFAQLFTSTDPRVQVFEIGQHPQAEILAALQKVKASFSFDTFRPLLVQ